MHAPITTGFRIMTSTILKDHFDIKQKNGALKERLVTIYIQLIDTRMVIKLLSKLNISQIVRLFLCFLS